MTHASITCRHKNPIWKNPPVAQLNVVEEFLCLYRAGGANDESKTNTALQTHPEKTEFSVV